MPDRKIRLGVMAAFIAAMLIGLVLYLRGGQAQLPESALIGPTPQITEPETRLIPAFDVAKAVGWSGNAAPRAAQGLAVSAFAKGLDHPRWMLVLPNGDVLVAETAAPETKPEGIKGRIEQMLMKRAGADIISANRITLLRDKDGDGVAEQRSVLIKGLNSPFGMALEGDSLYVTNNDVLLRFPFTVGQTSITAKPEKIISLPANGNHWTRNVVANADGTKLYVAIGSATNIAEDGIDAEQNRAMVIEVDAKTHDYRVFAAGLRNPIGMAWEPTTKALWAVVNERDELGGDLVPDYLTEVQFGGFYGWPYYYWGGYVDPRSPEPDHDMRQYTIRPDYALGAHVAALGLTFADKAKLGAGYAEGAFIGLHGSWNRKPLAGYKVIFVPFSKGHPAGKPKDILTGFLNADEQAQGRPVGVAIDGKGALLVADDVGNRIWRVTAKP
jgi:glucose/arabinose dehydrogenase